jgi:hypothetical protein
VSSSTRQTGSPTGSTDSDQLAGPSTVTKVPIGVRGQSMPALATVISTQPLLCGKPYLARTKPCNASPPLK